MKKIYLLPLLLSILISCKPATEEAKEEEMPAKELTLIVGTYTKRDSEGIYMYKVNPATGEARLVAQAKDIDDPSFLAVSPNEKYLYSASELEGGSLFSYEIGDSSLVFINASKTGGVHPCHVAVDKTGNWVFSGNYSDGSLSVLPVTGNGGLGEAVQVIKHEGSGPNKERQESPHVHSVNVSPNNADIYVPDLGIDKVMAYRFDEKTGQLTPGNSMGVTPGSGPRHFTFHPSGKYAYVIQELMGKVTAYEYTDNSLKQIQEISTLPAGFEGKNSSADIHVSPDGKFLYASNRYHDTIAVFSVGEDGKLSLVSHHSVMGQMPRNFAITPDGEYLFVANQETDNIVFFKRDTSTGKLEPTGKEIKVSMPVCLVFLKK